MNSIDKSHIIFQSHGMAFSRDILFLNHSWLRIIKSFNIFENKEMLQVYFFYLKFAAILNSAQSNFYWNTAHYKYSENSLTVFNHLIISIHMLRNENETVLTSVKAKMHFKTALSWKQLLTYMTLKILIARMCLEMCRQSALNSKWTETMSTFIRFLMCMYSNVSNQITRLFEFLCAVKALMIPHSIHL